MIRHFNAALAALILLGTSAMADAEFSLHPLSPTAELMSAEPLAYPGVESVDPVDPDFADFPVAETEEPLPLQRPVARPEDLVEKTELAKLPTTLKGANDFMCMAVAIYHEARGEITEGQQAVASVILQRALVPGRWSDKVCGVVVPVQFSFLKKDLSFAPIDDYKAWQKAIDVATVAMVEGPDPWLEAADHYHTKDVDPGWNDAMPVVRRIGHHIFYADPLSARRIKLAGLTS